MASGPPGSGPRSGNGRKAVRLGELSRELAPCPEVAGRRRVLRQKPRPLVKTFHQGLDRSFRNRHHPSGHPAPPFQRPCPSWIQIAAILKNHFPQPPKEIKPLLSKSLKSPLAQATSLYSHPFPL